MCSATTQIVVATATTENILHSTQEVIKINMKMVCESYIICGNVRFLFCIDLALGFLT